MTPFGDEADGDDGEDARPSHAADADADEGVR